MFGSQNAKAMIIKKHIDSLKSEVSKISHEVSRITQDAPIRTALPPFPTPDATEPSVSVAMGDFVKSGDVVFDIGAHVGALSSILSRLVGPKGQVISFEANPTTVSTLCANMVAKAHFNVWIVPEAVSNQPRQWTNIEEYGAASRMGSTGHRVRTTSIDYICKKHNLTPSFLKIDIEGEEINALIGGESLLESSRPTIIFEQNTGDDRAILFLKQKGYHLFDVASYTEIESSAGFEPGVQVGNILAIHNSKIADTIYRQQPQSSILKTFRAKDFHTDSKNKSNYSVSTTLKPGRYIYVLTEVKLDKQVDLFSCVKTEGTVLGHLATNGGFFIRNHRALPFEVEAEGDFIFEFGEIQSSNETSFHVGEVQLRRIDFAAS